MFQYLVIAGGILQGYIGVKDVHCCRTSHNRGGCSGSGRRSSVLFCIDTLVVVLDRVCRVADIVVSHVKKMSVWFRHGVLIIPSGNIEFFPDAEEIMF